MDPLTWLPLLLDGAAVAIAVALSLLIRDWRLIVFAALLAAIQLPKLVVLAGIGSGAGLGAVAIGAGQTGMLGILTSLAGLIAILLIALVLRQRWDMAQASVANEQRFRDFAESASDWLWETDAELRFTYMSPNVESIVGVPPEWHYGKTREDLLGADYDPTIWDGHLSTLRARQPFRDFDYRRVGRDVEPKWLRVSGKPAYDPRNRFLGYRGVASDVTAEMRMRHRATEMEARFRLALASIGQGFVLFDRDDRLVVCNEHLRAINDDVADLLRPGTSYEEIARAWAQRRGHDETWVQARLKLHREGGAPQVEQHPDGRWVRIEERRTSDDGFVSLWTDITELKDAERALKGRLEDLRLVTDNVPMLIVRIDAEERVLFVNRVGANWYNRPAREIIGCRMEELLSPQAYGRLRPRVLKALSGERVWFEDTVLYPDGIERVVEIIYVPEPKEDGEIASFLGLVLDVSGRRKVEQELDRFFAISVELFCIADLEGRIRRVNAAWQSVLGFREEEILGRTIADFVHPEDVPAIRAVVEELQAQSTTGQFTVRMQHQDGSWRWIEARCTSDVDSHRIYSTGEDVTQSRKAEDQLRQAQKMEAVGQLTGGIAHDFNNLLTVVQGNADMLSVLLPEKTTESELITGMARAAERGAELTRRLLAFSRQQPLSPKPMDPQKLLDDVGRLLLRTLAGEIEVQISVEDDTSAALVDAGQLENALLNLAINARDAMPDGGQLTIAARDTMVDRTLLGDGEEVAPGCYVEISVTDTGTGMPDEVIARAFDPFFTTKGVGKGSGLGLSMVYGFARQSNGFVRIYSELDMGTTIRLFLPAAAEGEEVQDPAAGTAELLTGSETVLLVEDDAEVARFTASALKSMGYTVLHAGDGAAALELVDGGAAFDLLLTDVALPGGMNGRQVAQQVCQRRGDIRVLFTSGFARDALGRDGRIDEGLTFLPKPFTLPALATKVREALDGAAAA